MLQPWPALISEGAAQTSPAAGMNAVVVQSVAVVARISSPAQNEQAAHTAALAPNAVRICELVHCEALASHYPHEVVIGSS